MFENKNDLDPRHRLDASKIVETAKNLADDINTRLPGSSLAGLSEELTKVAVATRTRGRHARRPILAIRAGPRPRRESALLHPRPVPNPPGRPSRQECHRRDLPALLHTDARRDQQPGAPLHARGDRRVNPALGLGGPDARHGHHHEAPGQGRGRAWIEGRRGSDMSRTVATENICGKYFKSFPCQFIQRGFSPWPG